MNLASYKSWNPCSGGPSQDGPTVDPTVFAPPILGACLPEDSGTPQMPRVERTGSQQSYSPAQLSWSPRKSWGEGSSRSASTQGISASGISGPPGPPGKMGPKGEPGDPVNLLRCQEGPRSCRELLSQGATLSGWYHLCLPEGRVLPVFCDMDTAGGGWLVFQRRQDGSVDFFRPWSSYKAGFGSQESEFWLGNENLHQLTQHDTWELRVELEDFTGNSTFALYETFRLLGEKDHYQLALGRFSEGTAGDSLSSHSGKPFTTFDADHDSREGNCAVLVHGAWWYGSCYRSNLNGLYAVSEATAPKYGIDWASGRGVGHPYRKVKMMLR
ncbi:ficolin-3 isoform X2 [Fukomys damarensis]|uniref:ficolin-3 isoform X2 n=1 Tax=Fukomys damarensis TaxID=885580 RepID=UPI0014553CBC|nr:ficolin-3 isoform X2 [Fukomys damarensis]